jgi:hypothetical protein
VDNTQNLSTISNVIRTTCFGDSNKISSAKADVAGRGRRIDG